MCYQDAAPSNISAVARASHPSGVQFQIDDHIRDSDDHLKYEIKTARLSLSSKPILCGLASFPNDVTIILFEHAVGLE